MELEFLATLITGCISLFTPLLKYFSELNVQSKNTFIFK